MIKINLLVEARADKVSKAPLISLGTGNINNYLLLGALVLAIGWVGLRYWQLSSRLADVKAEVAVNQREYDRLKPIIEEVEAFKKRNAELRHKIEVIEQLKANQYGPVRLMDEVSKALPELLWLTDLTVSGPAISMRGQALNENAVANFIANLGASPFFSEPVLKIMSQNEASVFTFDLSCNFSYTPRDAAQASAPRT
ncbi:MAG: PilN domain-containing protein [Acidobacteria bacterium]|nr:PilN domain-containing protein [Acidobacteriota bacterium]